MTRTKFLRFALLAPFLIGGLEARAQPQQWSASGTLLESCTCAVPCTCNFGEGPSPHSYCHAVFAYRLDKADWNGVDLSGLIVGGADGPKGTAGFLDDRATPVQRPLLQKLAAQIFRQGGPNNDGPRPWAFTHIVHEVKGNALRLAFGGAGGFTAQVLVGRDGKSPIVVENNAVWPIARAIKAKSAPLDFTSGTVGTIHGDGTNANYGAFTFRGAVSESTATAAAAPPKKACCGAGHKAA